MERKWRYQPWPRCGMLLSHDDDADDGTEMGVYQAWPWHATHSPIPDPGQYCVQRSHMQVWEYSRSWWTPKKRLGIALRQEEEIYKICVALNFLQMDKTVALVGSDLCKRKLNLFVFDILMFFPFDISDYSWVDGWPWWTCLSFVFVFCPRQLLKVGGWSESESGAHPLQLIGF